MITISNLAMQFGGSVLFKQVDLQFTPGNCYGVIGANGAGKSTFLKILSGELEPTSGSISFKPGARLSVLKQDQNQYDAYSILDTVIMGNQHLYDIMKEKDALYEKDEFTEEDGMRASELETEFAELDGWEAKRMKEYQFAYGHGSVTVPLDEGSVLAVLHGNDAPAMQDIRAAGVCLHLFASCFVEGVRPVPEFF